LIATDTAKADYTDARAKHLGLIQDVVSRMATASASVKRVAIIVVGGAAAVAARGNCNVNDLPLLAIILVAVFWLIDARYVQQERWFRDLYERVAKEPHDQRPSFSITPPPDIRSGRSLFGSAFGWSTVLYYGALAAFLILTWRTLA
jgi:hypothetical protein